MIGDDNSHSKMDFSRRKFLTGAATAAAYAALPRWLIGRSGLREKMLALPSTSRTSVPQGSIIVNAAAGHLTNSFRPDQALGTSIDIQRFGAVDELYTLSVIEECLSAGWGPVTYRQNTELKIAAWHWNPTGKWSDEANKSGYFTGSSELTGFIRHSYGYPLPHRGHTRNLGTLSGYSRITDGNPDTFWKSNPYLTRHFTGEDDSHHPQWVVVDFGAEQALQVIEIDWTDPYAIEFEIQYWTGKGDAMGAPTSGVWTAFPNGIVYHGKGGNETINLCDSPIMVRFVRILMTGSSNTYGTHGTGDIRSSLGYAIKEIHAGTLSGDGKLVDIIQHSPDQNQTTTYCSSIDPWHSAADLDEHAGDQTGFDLFFTSGVTNKLPAIIPIAMIYGSHEDAAAEIAYLRQRGYPVSHVEMGEEPDGQYFMPEDYAELYLQFATAIHKLVPDAKLGGPVFTGVNEDIKVWPDEKGRTSWLGRFLDYLKSRDRISELAFMSFEHYPFAPCDVTWSSLYQEPQLVSHIMQVWKDDGLPDNVPMLITESNLSWSLDQSFVNIFGGLWLAEYAGSFLTAGGSAIYYFQFFPMPLSPGCHGWGTFSPFNADKKHIIKQYTSQYHASRVINLEWVMPGHEVHETYHARSNVKDAAGQELLAVYVVKRPDDQWSLMIVNRDQENSYAVDVTFDVGEGKKEVHFSGPVTMVTFGSEQYVWHSGGPNSEANPDSPPVTSTVEDGEEASFTLPKASITILRGKVEGVA